MKEQVQFTERMAQNAKKIVQELTEQRNQATATKRSIQSRTYTDCKLVRLPIPGDNVPDRL